MICSSPSRFYNSDEGRQLQRQTDKSFPGVNVEDVILVYLDDYQPQDNSDGLNGPVGFFARVLTLFERHHYGHPLWDMWAHQWHKINGHGMFNVNCPLRYKVASRCIQSLTYPGIWFDQTQGHFKSENADQYFQEFGHPLFIPENVQGRALQHFCHYILTNLKVWRQVYLGKMNKFAVAFVTSPDSHLHSSIRKEMDGKNNFRSYIGSDALTSGFIFLKQNKHGPDVDSCFFGLVDSEAWAQGYLYRAQWHEGYSLRQHFHAAKQVDAKDSSLKVQAYNLIPNENDYLVREYLILRQKLIDIKKIIPFSWAINSYPELLTHLNRF